MTIRPARKDDVRQATPLILAAMGSSMFAETASTTREQAEETVAYLFTLGGNHLSYQVTLVYEIEQSIAGVVIYYDGSEEAQLFASAAKQFRRLRNGPAITPDREAQDDELYCSILSVDPHFGRSGIGTALLNAIEEEAHRLRSLKLSLNVAVGNTAALRLYKRLGYVIVGEMQIDTYAYYHMVKDLTRVPVQVAAANVS